MQTFTNGTTVLLQVAICRNQCVFVDKLRRAVCSDKNNYIVMANQQILSISSNILCYMNFR